MKWGVPVLALLVVLIAAVAVLAFRMMPNSAPAHTVTTPTPDPYAVPTTIPNWRAIEFCMKSMHQDYPSMPAPQVQHACYTSNGTTIAPAP